MLIEHTRCVFILPWIFLQVHLMLIDRGHAFTLKNNNIASHVSQLNDARSTKTKKLKKNRDIFLHKKNDACSRLNIQRGGDENVPIKEKKHAWTSQLKGPRAIGDEIKYQFRIRVAADPDFVQKSIVEIIFAILMQFAAEVSKRGRHRIVPEIDFVIAGIFTAIAGKYYSMWRVAKTVSSSESTNDGSDHGGDASSTSWRSNVPTNAFQDTLLDGKTKPDILQRVAAFFVPIPPLFQAGFIASAIGYGFTAILISLRSILIPSYKAVTVNVNILHVCLYTGSFMAVISNIRYQLLQGLIEPKIIDKLFGGVPAVQTTMISLIRLANGLLGSYLAITGMKLLALQKLK